MAEKSITNSLPGSISPRLPRREMAIFMFVVGLGTAFIWLSDVVSALIAGQAPQALGPYTTAVTYMLDIGIITPAVLLSGALLLRRQPLGYLLTATLTILLAQIGLIDPLRSPSFYLTNNGRYATCSRPPNSTAPMSHASGRSASRWSRSGQLKAALMSGLPANGM